MSCPRPEVLSRWVDGTLRPREARSVRLHAEACDACRAKAGGLRAAGLFLTSVVEPGPDCLSEAAMAALLEGRVRSGHVETCPRCAAEFASLKGARKGSGIHRRAEPRVPVARWAAAAAVLFAAGVLVLVLKGREGRPAAQIGVVRVPEAVAPAPPVPPPPAPLKPRETPPPPSPLVLPPKVAPAPKAPEAVAPPDPLPPPPREVAEPRPTVPETPARRELALQVKTGALSALAGGKWEKARRIEEGVTLRAEGRTGLEFAGARVTLEGSSRFALAGDSIALADGVLSAEVPMGSPLVIDLEGIKVEPRTVTGRVLLSARPDRVVIDEGSARAGGQVLAEGVEHHVKKGKIEAQKRRSLPAAARPRETVTWRLDFANPASVRSRLMNGSLLVNPAERVLLSGTAENPTHCAAQIAYLGQDERGFFQVRQNTALRFRYFLMEPAMIELVLGNRTKQENFNKVLETVSGQWTTVTLPLRDIPANTGGKKVACETGDWYRTVGWFIGKPGTSPQMLIDLLEIVEIEGR